MADVRMLPEKEVVGIRPYLCGYCGEPIATGERQKFYRGFDPDRSSDGGRTWGAFVTERRHLGCTPEALARKSHA